MVVCVGEEGGRRGREGRGKKGERERAEGEKLALALLASEHENM